MNSGIYIRVGKENKLLEEMTIEERKEWLDSRNLNKENLYMIIEHDNKNDIDCPIARQTLHKTQGRVLKR